MSADNGYTVSLVYREPNRFGIFYESASVDHGGIWYTSENAERVYSNPIAAIVAAHRLNDESPTEYGVYVNSLVLSLARNVLDTERSRVSYAD
jgi:hypothetical protein